MKYYHAHIYFNDDEAALAVALHSLLLKQKQWNLQVSRLIHKPIGPHPIPMFEVDFSAEFLKKVSDFLEQNRNGLSVLIHPVSEEEVLDHTERATWLGQKLELNIDFLKDFMAGKVGAVNHTIKRG